MSSDREIRGEEHLARTMPPLRRKKCSTELSLLVETELRASFASDSVSQDVRTVSFVVPLAIGAVYNFPTSAACFIASSPCSTLSSGVVLNALTDPPAVAASAKEAAA